MSRGIDRPGMRVYDGAVRPARQHSRLRGGGSRQSRRCLFERLEQEEQRLKKHDGHWMDIVRSLQLESFILTKLTKPLVRQLSRPIGQLPKRCTPDVRGRNHFLGG